jgi:site-specific recombinase XerD
MSPDASLLPVDEHTPLSIDEGFDRYQLIRLSSRNFAQRTRREYTTDLSGLLSFLKDDCGLQTIGSVTRNHLEGYLAELDHRGLVGSTRRRKVASIRSFFVFLHDQGLITADPAQKLIPPAREHYQPRVLSQREYQRLQLAVAHQTRDAALIELLLQTGIRLSEFGPPDPRRTRPAGEGDQAARQRRLGSDLR